MAAVAVGEEQPGDDGDVSMEQRRCLARQMQEGFSMEQRNWITYNHKTITKGICGLSLLARTSIVELSQKHGGCCGLI
jgi:hypothetical protein